MPSSSPGPGSVIRGLCLLIILLVSLCPRPGGGSGLQRFVVRPSSVTAREGEDVTLRCVVAGQQGRVQWTKDGFALGFERHVPGYPRYTYLGDAGRGQHHLAISSISLTDDGEYQCQVGPSLTNPPIWAAANVTVLMAPSSISMAEHRDGAVVEVEAGSLLILRCTVADARPPPTLLWYMDGTQVDQGDVKTQVVASSLPGRWSVGSQMMVRANPGDDGKRITCRALHPGVISGGGALTFSVTLSVRQVAGAPKLEGAVLGEVVSGSWVTLVCSSPGNHTNTELRIYKRGQAVAADIEEEGNVTRARGRVRVTPADNKAEIKCEVSNQASRTPRVTSTRLSVLFKPRDVSGSVKPHQAEEGSVATLSCLTSSSHPPANLTWTSRGLILPSSNIHVTPAAFGGTSTRSELQLRVTSRDNGRTFLCKANNGLGPPIQKEITLKVLYAPIWKKMVGPEVDVWEGSAVIITVTAIANPGPVRYWWRRGREELAGAGGELRLRKAIRDMTGNYTVSAYSRRGAINTTFFINVQYGPENLTAPERVVVGVGESINIKCSATGNPLPHLTWTNRNVTLGSGMGVARLVVESARPDQTGVYHCVADNNNPAAIPPAVATKLVVKRGVSDSKDDSGGGSRHLTSLLLPIIVLAALAILAINIAIVTCLLHRFRRKSSIQSTGSTKITSVTTRATSSSSPENHHYLHQHHSLTALTRGKPPPHKYKDETLTSKTCNARSNLVPQASPSSHKHRAAGKAKPIKQSKAKKKAITKILHNGRIHQEETNKKGSSHFPQNLLARNENLSKTKPKESPLLVSPEARSLIPHYQDGDLPTLLQNTKHEDDHASESSHESTETAIYCENSIPPPTGSEPTGGYNALQHTLHNIDQQYNMEDPKLQQTLQETEVIWQTQQQEPIAKEPSEQVLQAMIMTELQKATSQKVDQCHHIYASEDLGVRTDNGQPSLQAMSQSPLNNENSESPGSSMFSHLQNSSTTTASHNILTRAQQHSKLNYQSSTKAGYRQERKNPESSRTPQRSLLLPTTPEEHQERVIPSSPLRPRRHHQLSASPTRGQKHPTEIMVRVQHQKVPPHMPISSQHHLISSDLPPRVKHPNLRHSSPTKTKLNSTSKSSNQFEYHTPLSSSTVSYYHAPISKTRLDNLSRQCKPSVHLNQNIQTHSHRNQHQILPSPIKSSQPPPLPLSTLHQPHLMSNPHSKNHHHFLPTQPSSNPNPLHTSQSPSQLQPSPLPIRHHHPHTSLSPGYDSSPPTPTTLPQHHLPNSGYYHPPPTPLQNNLTSSSGHQHPPPNPPRPRHQRPSSSPVIDRLPPLGPSTSRQHHHPPPIQSTHSRQQSKSMVFRKSISRSLDDYSSKVASHDEVNQEPKNYDITQKGSLHSKSVLTGFAAVSRSLPKDMKRKESCMIPSSPYEAHAHQRATLIGNLMGPVADGLTPAATSSPITGQRRSRFPDDFLWQGSPGK